MYGRRRFWAIVVALVRYGVRALGALGLVSGPIAPYPIEPGPTVQLSRAEEPSWRALREQLEDPGHG